VKSKRIIVLLGFVCVLAGSLSFAADQKPFKGWVIATNNEVITLDQAKQYPYLAKVIGLYGEPDPVSLWLLPPSLVTYEGNNNVGGDSIHKNAQLFYIVPLDPYYTRFILLFYEDSTITTASGDQIFVEIEGVYYSSIDKLIAKETVIGGTGKFEGAEGSFTGTMGFNKDGQSIILYDGYITTVGKAKKH
jgi:hypothetical protein